ncbi:MAG: hypothetical protein AAGF82_00155 [Pseudomonadota bacterium]
MPDERLTDISSDDPPADFSELQKALWWLRKGNLGLGPEWERAHMICQEAEGERAHDWVHALCHLVEGDHGNAAYWFRRAGQSSGTTDPGKVWDQIAAAYG